MQYRLTRIDPMSAAKTLAAAYAVLGLLTGMLRFGLDSMDPDVLASSVDVVIYVITFAVGGFVGTLIASYMYNAGASWSKGIEISLDVPEQT